MAATQPQKRSKAGRAGIFLGVLALLGLLGWGWLVGLPQFKQTPWYLKFTIKQYLRRHAAKDPTPIKFDGNIQQTLSKMRADLEAFQADLARRETNLLLLQQKIAGERKESLDRQDQARGLRHAVANLESDAAAKERQLSNRTAEVEGMATNVVARQTNVAHLREELAAFQKQTTTISNALAALQADLGKRQTNLQALAANPAAKAEHQAAQRELAGVKQAARDKQDELAKARQQAARKAEELASREAGLKTAEATLSAARTNLANLQSNLLVLRANTQLKHRGWVNRVQEGAEKSASVTNTIEELKRQQDQLAALRKELPARQRELAAKEAGAGNQAAYFIGAVRQKMAACTTYGAMYQLIKIELEAAEPLLAAGDLATKRDGFALAAEAARHAGTNAENYWLASRIAEAYLLPNMHLADPPDGPQVQTLAVLQFCSDMFAQTMDTNLYLHSTRLQLKHAPSPQKADALRYAMALELESMELKREALVYLREITDPNLTYTAGRRIIRIEKEIPRPMTPPKATPKPAPKPTTTPAKP